MSERKPINHGTPAGYWAHAKRAIPPCEPCRDAHNEHRRKRYVPKRDPNRIITYDNAHKLVRKAWGYAKHHQCACGQAAEEWAYQSSTNEIVDAQGMRYSTNPDDYAPMCIACHRRMDWGKVTCCRRGHSYEGQNLSLAAGRRDCRVCRKERVKVANLGPEQLERRRASKREYMRRRSAAAKVWVA